MISNFTDLFKSLSFVMDFKDPATLYIESLIAVHNNVMWYLVLILTIVYWTLYKIVKDSLWTSFNKQNGFLRIFFSSKLFLTISSIFIVIYVELYAFIVKLFFKSFQNVFFNVLNQTEIEQISVFSQFFFSNFDQELFKEGAALPFWATSSQDLSTLRELWTQRYLDNLLFGVTNAGYFYYGRTAAFDSALTTKYSPFLTVQQFKHSTLLEVIWATFPSVIILLILVPSILLIYSIDEDLDPEFTIKVVGHQWFWSYEFDGWLPISALNAKNVQFSLDDPAIYSTFEFDSCMVITDSLELGQRRLLEVDNPLVVPCSVGLRFLITSADVLHAWALPQLGIKVDAVPGRLSQYISMVRRPGIFYGQCSEICGVAHAFMPIVVHGAPYASVLPVWTDQITK